MATPPDDGLKLDLGVVEALAQSPGRERLGRDEGGAPAQLGLRSLTVARAGVGDQRIRHVLDVGAVAQLDAELRLAALARVAAAQLRRRLRRQVNARVRLRGDLDSQPIAGEDAAGRVLDVDERHRRSRASG